VRTDVDTFDDEMFWRTTQRCMNHYYYGRQNSARPKKLPRLLLVQTPEDVVASKKRRAKANVGATPKLALVRDFNDYASSGA
jgi:hypothetical protein